MSLVLIDWSLGFLIQSISESVQFLNEVVFPHGQDKGVRTSDFFQDKAFQMCNCMTRSVVKMVTSWFCEDFPLDIVPMFTHPFLERAPRFSYIFTVGIIRTIVLDTLPVVDYILVLASDVVLDGMAVSSHLSYYFVGRLQSVWAGRTLFAVASTFSPAWHGTTGSGWSGTGHRIKPGFAEKSS